MTKSIWTALIVMALVGCGGGSEGVGDPPVLTGTFRDSVVKGIRYVATAPNGLVREGVTDDGGRYSYYEGGKIDFFVGQILLASVNNPTATTVTAFLAQEPVATNISRFLQTLDEDGDPSNGIVIPTTVQLNANGIGGGSLDFASAGFDTQFDSVKPTLLANSSISGSTSLVSSSVANLHTENSSRYALISETRLGNALEGKLAYPESYNREVLNIDEFQRVRQYVWESLVRPKLDATITLGTGKVDSIDGAHELVQSTLNTANAVLDMAALGLSAKDLLDRGATGFSTARKVYFSISKIEDVLGSACSVEAFLAEDNTTINSQSDPVKYIRDFSPSGSSFLSVDAAPLCDAYGVAHGAFIAKDDPRADTVNSALSDMLARTETELWKSANHGWSLKNSFGNGVSLSPIDKAKYAIQVAQIVNDVQGAVTLSLNTQEVTSLLVARIYLDTWVRSAGDRNFMSKLISGQTGNGALTTSRYEDIEALINFYSSTGVWCDIKTFFKGGLIVGVDDILSGKKPNYVTCSPNVDRDLINRTIDGAVAEMTTYLRVLKAKIGPFAQSSSATFDLPSSPTCVAPQVLSNGLCATSSISSISPTTATVNVPVTFAVAGQNLPLTAVMSVADANCGTPTNRSASGFSVLCTPLGTGGSKTVTVKTNTQANGGTVIDASRTINVLPATTLVTLSVSTGSAGTVTIGNRIDCLQTCRESYPLGSTVTLVANRVLNSSFGGWTGACSAILEPVCTLTLDSSKTVTAIFKTDIPGTTFTDNGDGTITDRNTNLMWMRCSWGQTWTGDTCSGSASTLSRYAQTLTASFAGYSNWRVPLLDELRSIVDMSRQDPAIHVETFPNTPNGWFWSASEFCCSNHLWFVDFRSGDYSYTRDTYNFVRLVRNAP